ncbi:MAG: signal peptidase II [Myxococcales bacterium]|nr:signal peptidase II [Myxococcales bacterium]
MKKRWDKLMLMGMVLSFCVGCDQTTKRVAEHTLKGSPMQSMLGDTIRLQYAENTGAFLGMGAGFPQELKFWVFFLLPILMLGGMVLFGLLSRKISSVQLWMLMLVVGGGLGNLVDRVFLSGRVTDFLNIGVGTLRTAIFNVADIAIMLGSFGLILSSVWQNTPIEEELEEAWESPPPLREEELQTPPHNPAHPSEG